MLTVISPPSSLHSRQHGPVGATDEIINDIPHHTLTDEELGREKYLFLQVAKQKMTCKESGMDYSHFFSIVAQKKLFRGENRVQCL